MELFYCQKIFFFGTPIATCIMLLKKGKKDNTFFFIDASKEFVKSGNNNKLSQDNVEKIVGTYEKREPVEYFANIVDYSEIADNNYNLSVATYVEAEDTREKVNIDEVNKKIEVLLKKEDLLKEKIAQIVKEI